MPVEDFIENTISYFYCHNQMKHKHFVGIILLSLAWVFLTILSHHIKELSLIGSFFFLPTGSRISLEMSLVGPAPPYTAILPLICRVPRRRY